MTWSIGRRGERSRVRVCGEVEKAYTGIAVAMKISRRQGLIVFPVEVKENSIVFLSNLNPLGLVSG